LCFFSTLLSACIFGQCKSCLWIWAIAYIQPYRCLHLIRSTWSLLAAFNSLSSYSEFRITTYSAFEAFGKVRWTHPSMKRIWNTVWSSIDVFGNTIPFLASGSGSLQKYINQHWSLPHFVTKTTVLVWRIYLECCGKTMYACVPCCAYVCHFVIKCFLKFKSLQW
jgi:hypothetical protein